MSFSVILFFDELTIKMSLDPFSVSRGAGIYRQFNSMSHECQAGDRSFSVLSHRLVRFDVPRILHTGIHHEFQQELFRRGRRHRDFFRFLRDNCGFNLDFSPGTGYNNTMQS